MKTFPKRFLQDPEWHLVEEMVMEFLAPLLDLSTIDKTQPAEHVKAELIAREFSYNSLINFVRTSGIIRSDKLIENKPNIFK